jgi:16S rRNA (guanine527-N7)-methyltransferase
VTAALAGDDPADAALAQGAEALGVRLSPGQREQFSHYSALLREGKRAFNLTALVDPLDIAVKHFVDALSVLTVLPEGPLWLVDIGTGAGFPGLPLKIARPELAVTLVEATAKKAGWVRQTAGALGLDGVEVVAARAEELAHRPEHRGQYDVAVARAVAPLAALLELCAPFLRVGGLLVAEKSAAGVESELPKTLRAQQVLGAAWRETRDVGLPQLPNRRLVVFEQVQPAPDEYPRRPGLPNKRPL